MKDVQKKQGNIIIVSEYLEKKKFRIVCCKTKKCTGLIKDPFPMSDNMKKIYAVCYISERKLHHNSNFSGVVKMIIMEP